VAGVTDTSCDGLQYTFTVPAGCSSSARCGLVFDIHGQSMSAGEQNANTGFRASIGAESHIVVQPTAPMRWGEFTWWIPNVHAPKLESMIRQLVASPEVDANRVHVTGFSQGGFTTWKLLCLASDVICSAAPLAASGVDDWDAHTLGFAETPDGYEETCFGTRSSGSSGPPTKRSILYGTGTMDNDAPIARAHIQRQHVLNAYGMDGANMTALQPEGADYEWSRWTMDGVTFEYLEHNYEGNSYEGHLGHCIPRQGGVCDATSEGGSSQLEGGYLNHGCCADITWSEVVLVFFARHPCQEVASGDDQSNAPHERPSADPSVASSSLRRHTMRSDALATCFAALAVLGFIYA